MLSLVIQSCLFTVAVCRITFTYSEFLDGTDLKESNSTYFECPHGCMVYSTTDNPNLVIDNNSTRVVVTNLNTLTNYNNAQDRSYLYGFSLPAATYRLRNTIGLSGVLFNLYIVSSTAPNYGESIRVAESFSIQQFWPTTSGLITIMTRGTAIRIAGVYAEQEIYPKVFAFGYDAINDGCWPVFNGTSLSHAQQAQIDIYGPITTIQFGASGSNGYARVSGDVMPDLAEQRNSLTISSPGFHGCSNRWTSQYQYNLDKISRRFTSSLNEGINIKIRSQLWISVVSDSLNISGLEDQTLVLYGLEAYQRDFPVNSVSLGIEWQRRNPTSMFAVQIDATKNTAAATLSLLLPLFLCILRK